MFDSLQPVPPDPILGLIGAFRDDPNPNKVDLGAGVYKEDSGDTPVLQSVAAAERRIVGDQLTKAYVAPPGDPAFIAGIVRELFGPEHPAVLEQRVGAVQAPGGCGALRLGAELVNRVAPGAHVWASTPTWANHIPLLGDCGLEISQYP